MGLEVLLPSMSLFGLSASRMLESAKVAGFDGLELFLSPGAIESIGSYRRVAMGHGLKLHLHQWWSLDENPTHWFNHVWDFFGYLAPSGYPLKDHVPLGKEPTVVYADRCHEAIGHPRYWLQTVATFDAKGAYRISPDEFMRTAVWYQLPIVFDVQHYLVYRLELSGVEKLPRDPEVLLAILRDGWFQLGPLVKEIHLTDFNPALGHTRGRNVFTGDGICPLSEFCRLVKNSGWKGTVVPEVQPSHLFPYGPRRLAELRKRVESLLG